MVMRALVAEMNCTEWVVPPLPLPYPNLNVNPVKQCVEREVETQEAQLGHHDYSSMAVLGIKGALKLVAWHTREKWWRGAQRQIVLLPKDALSALVDGVRNDIRKSREGAEGVTTGDVLVAWLLKVGADFVHVGYTTSSWNNTDCIFGRNVARYHCQLW